MAREVEHARAARQVVARPALGLDHQRVRAVPAPEHRPHLAQDVGGVDLVDLEQRQDGALLVRQGDLARMPSHDLCTAGHGERDREELAAFETHLVEDRLVLVPRHEPVERREGADRQHLEVVLGAQRERHHREVLRPLEQLAPLLGVVDHEIDEAPAERRDERGLAGAGRICAGPAGGIGRVIVMAVHAGAPRPRRRACAPRGVPGRTGLAAGHPGEGARAARPLRSPESVKDEAAPRTSSRTAAGTCRTSP